MHYRTHGCGPRGGWNPRSQQIPPVNITETDDQFTIHLFAPSLQKDQISITTVNDVLSVKYKGSDSAQTTQFRRKEYRPEEIDRAFDLKGKVNIDGIKASYEEGIVKIELPKSDSAKRPAKDVPVN